MWFRRDLRLDDNPAWAAATASCDAVLAVFVLDPRLLGRAGPHRTAQLLADLAALDRALRERAGSGLHVRRGDPAEVLPGLAGEIGAGTAFWNSDVTPFAAARDEAILRTIGIPVETFAGSLVHAPGTVLTAKGGVSRVFTPFYKAWLVADRRPWPEPGGAVVLDRAGDPLPRPDGPVPLTPGEEGARSRLEAFLRRVDRYGDDHDRLDVDGTSGLSADLKFGTISPRTLVDAVGDATRGRAAFVRQVAWRDWYAHLLADLPHLTHRAMRERYDTIPWRNDPAEIEAWTHGMTGFPVIDAAMRQLEQTGWMHNRARLLCGSFLVKNLLVDWRIGERHFRHLLVDGDVPQNVGNWQWVAGTGPDAAAYNRIFNPVLQGKRFDPDGVFVRRWVPELRDLRDGGVHEPWLVADELFGGGSHAYPRPIVDLGESRRRAIEVYAAVNDAER